MTPEEIVEKIHYISYHQDALDRECMRLVDQMKSVKRELALITKTLTAVKYTLLGAIAIALIDQLGLLGLLKLIQ